MKERKIIDAVYERDAIIDWIKNYFIQNGNEKTKAVIGISGGKDSTIAAALLVRALGPQRVVGVLMPQGTQKDIDDAYEVCKILNIPHFTIDIESACNSLYRAVDEGYDFDRTCSTDPRIATNTPARMRMITLYTIATMVEGRVCNTGNASELYVGYTTKYGDLAGDFALFNDYYVRDVLAIGSTMSEIPDYLLFKIPSDGMCNMTDEENLGFSYETLDEYCLDSILPSYDILRNIKQRHAISKHKNVILLPTPRVRSRHKEGAEWKPAEPEYWF